MNDVSPFVADHSNMCVACMCMASRWTFVSYREKTRMKVFSKPGSPAVGRSFRIAAAVAATSALLLSACSEGSTDADSGSTSSDSAAADAAKALVVKHEAAPSDIPQQVPLPSAPPTGKTVVLVQCDFAQCKPVEEAMKEATAAVGWNLKIIPFKQADPATFVSGMNQALQEKPVAVAFAGQPYQVWEKILPDFTKANIPIIPNYVGPIPEGVKGVAANIMNPDDLQIDASNLADWFVANSGAKGHALAWGIPGFPILGAVPDQFEEAVSKQCSECKVTSIESSIADSANPAAINGQIISALQRDPSIKYIMSANGQLNAGLKGALKAAGLSDIKYMATLPGVENIDDIKQGADNAVTPVSQPYIGWVTVDTAIRVAMGLDIEPGGGGQVHRLITTANVDSVADPVEDAAAALDVPAKFKALWHVG